MFQTLSGRFFIVTVLFVVLAEILILVPSVARFRLDYLRASLERAQIASLALEAEDRISSDLEVELLETAEVYNVVLRRNEVRQLVLSSPIPAPVVSSFDLRDPTVYDLVVDGLAALFDPSDHVIRVLGDPVRRAGLLIEITMSTRGLNEALVAYASQVLWVSTAISALTAVLLFWAVRQALVLPMRHGVSHMQSYANAPEVARSIIDPNARLREAQEAMNSMQIELTAALKQKERLAQLGSAVAKISHDLRNILSSAQLFTDRIEASQDPTVARLAPKLVRSISRAVHLCETTLAFGRAEESAPQLEWLPVSRLFVDVIEAEQLASEGKIPYAHSAAEDLQLWADPEQLYRVISNLCRNARQALESISGQGHIVLSAVEGQEHWWIKVKDNGPGLPARAKINLFTAFQGGTTKGGSGLGLAISAELIRGHGGQLSLEKSDAQGSIFAIKLPKANI